MLFKILTLKRQHASHTMEDGIVRPIDNEVIIITNIENNLGGP